MSFVGYRKLRAGRIHLFCPKCKRKLSNMRRDRYDPPKAALVQVRCERCSAGDKDGSQVFLDPAGRELCQFCGRWTCERAGGRADCDERLIRPSPESPKEGK